MQGVDTAARLGYGDEDAMLMTIPVAIVFFVFQRRIMATTEGAEKG